MEAWRYWVLLGVSVLVGLQMLLLQARVADAVAVDLPDSSDSVCSLEEDVARQVAYWGEDGPRGIVLENLTMEAEELLVALRAAEAAASIVASQRDENLFGEREVTVFLYNCRVTGYIDLSDLSNDTTSDVSSGEQEYEVEGPTVSLSFHFRDCEFDHLSFSDTGTSQQIGAQAYPSTGPPAPDDTTEASGSGARRRSSLTGDLVFHNCRIEELWLHGISVYGAVQISSCEIGSLSWAGSDFRDRVFVGDTTILHAADLARVRFVDELKIHDVKFRGSVEFEECLFEGETSLQGTFEEVADFEGARFAADLDMSGTRFLGGAYLALASFDGAAKNARGEALLRSSLGWKVVGDQSRASYYFREHMIERRASKALPIRLLEMVLVDWTSGYGTMWHRILVTWAVVILASTVVLWMGRGIEHGDDRIPVRSFWLSLYFSIVTFTTLGYGDYRPRCAYKIVADLTALLGAFMMALFVVVFVRQFAP